MNTLTLPTAVYCWLIAHTDKIGLYRVDGVYRPVLQIEPGFGVLVEDCNGNFLEEQELPVLWNVRETIRLTYPGWPNTYWRDAWECINIYIVIQNGVSKCQKNAV